jgi:hypothetical protein
MVEDEKAHTLNGAYLGLYKDSLILAIDVDAKMLFKIKKEYCIR